LPVRLLLFSMNLFRTDSKHSTFQISYPFSIAEVVPKNPSTNSEALCSIS
jgi:hypothetical protein